MNKVVFFAFRDNSMCFVHVLLNVLDMHNKGFDAKIVMEGEAVKLIKELEEKADPLYLQVKELGLFDCICRACSFKMGVLAFNETCGIPLNADLSGHPAMSKYIDQGYQVITM